MLSGRIAEARRLYTQIADYGPPVHARHWAVLAVKAQALAHLGENDQAVDAIQQALRLSPDNGQLAIEAAVVYVVIGDRGSALFHARRAAEHQIDPNWFALPFFDPLRNDSAFQLLAARGHLTDRVQNHGDARVDDGLEICTFTEDQLGTQGPARRVCDADLKFVRNKTWSLGGVPERDLELIRQGKL